MARILLIDDDRQVRTVLAGFMTHDGHEVHSAADGKKAQVLLNEITFDLVVTDIVMPDQNGFEVIKQLLSQPTRPRIIAISGGSPSRDKHNLLIAASCMPIEQVLTKPISYEQLSRAVSEVLRSPLQISRATG